MMAAAGATTDLGSPGMRRTAVRPAGRETSSRIVEAAYRLLRTGPLTSFSLRATARAANVRLAGVQYYFPSMADLVRGIIALNARLYADAYREAVARAETPRARFEAVIRFNLRDIQQTDTRRFFVQLWALMESLDGFSGSLLNELYAAQVALLGERIAELHPRIDEREARRRAELVAALIEGMFITLPEAGERPDAFDARRETILRLCSALADGRY